MIEIPLQIIELEQENYHILIEGHFKDETPSYWIIDTGASKTVLDLNMNPFFELIDSDETDDYQSAGINQGMMETSVGRMSYLRFGNMQITDQKVALIPWSPLARGFLAGNRKPEDRDASANNSATSRAKTDELALRYYYGDADFEIVDALTRLAQQKGVSNAQLAYAWLLHKGVTAPIVGASKLPQLEQALTAIRVSLTPEEIVELEAPYRPHPIIGHT